MPAMVEADTQLEEIQTAIFPVPLCDEEDEPVARASEPEDVEASDDVEGHGGSGFTEPA
jgi:hypothetical protein